MALFRKVFLGGEIACSILIVCMILVPLLLPIEYYSILSGSMEPSVPYGSLVIAIPTDPANLAPNDIIAYRLDETVVCHRIVERHASNRGYITKGDANDTADPNVVLDDAIIGRIEAAIPYLGLILISIERHRTPLLLLFIIINICIYAMPKNVQRKRFVG